MKSILVVDNVVSTTGLKRGQIAKLFGVSRETVSRWKHVPHHVTLFLMVYAMYVDLKAETEFGNTPDEQQVDSIRKRLNRFLMENIR